MVLGPKYYNMNGIWADSPIIWVLEPLGELFLDPPEGFGSSTFLFLIQASRKSALDQSVAGQRWLFVAVG